MLLLSDPAIGRIPVDDCGEELVDLRNVPQLAVDSRKQDPEGAWARLRSGLVVRLLEAQMALPANVRLLVIEGYRPAALQEKYFTEYADELARTHPEWPAPRVYKEASKHVSPVAVAPHPCGAAVDLTLTEGGVEVDLGTPVNATPEASAGSCFTRAEGISPEARRRRDVLGSALSAAGMVNYPPEWWHWSYGDRYWAASVGARQAVYGPQ